MGTGFNLESISWDIIRRQVSERLSLPLIVRMMPVVDENQHFDSNRLGRTNCKIPNWLIEFFFVVLSCTSDCLLQCKHRINDRVNDNGWSGGGDEYKLQFATINRTKLTEFLVWVRNVHLVHEPNDWFVPWKFNKLFMTLRVANWPGLQKNVRDP